LARKEKEQKVQELAKKMGSAQSLIFTDYRGLNVAQINKLRDKLREEGIEYQVVKNTLALLASRQAEIENLEEILTGPTAVAFGQEDPVAPAKVLSDFSKDNKALEIKGGILSGNLISPERVGQLAKIPPREELLAKAFGSMKAPISGFAFVLAGIPRKFLYCLNAIKEEKAE